MHDLECACVSWHCMYAMYLLRICLTYNIILTTDNVAMCLYIIMLF